MTPKRAELLGAAGLLLAYLPVCLFTFAVTDDWVVLDHVLNGTTKWGLSEMSHGRLLHGLAVATVELAADSLEDFQIFRLVCVLSLVVLYILMGRFFMTVKLFESLNLFTPPPHVAEAAEAAGCQNTAHAGLSYLLAFSLTLIPAFQVFSAWVVCWSFVLAVVLALLAFRTLLTSLRFKHLFSVILLVASMLIYQSAAMTFLFFAAVCSIAQGRLGNENVWFHVRAYFVMGCAMLAALLAARYLAPLIAGFSSSRTELNFDVLWMGYWYVRVLLLVAIPNYVVHESVVWMLLSIPVVVTGFLVLCRNKRIRLYVLFCMVAVHSPVMFTEGSNSGFRTTLPMEMFTCAFFVVGLLAIFHHRPKMVRAALCVLLPCLTFHNIYMGYVRAQQVDLAVLEEKLLAEVSPEFAGSVSYDATNGPRCRFEPCRPPSEFGITSTYQPWSGKGMLEYLKRKHDMAFVPIRMRDRKKADRVIVIDR